MIPRLSENALATFWLTWTTRRIVQVILSELNLLEPILG